MPANPPASYCLLTSLSFKSQKLRPLPPLTSSRLCAQLPSNISLLTRLHRCLAEAAASAARKFSSQSASKSNEAAGPASLLSRLDSAAASAAAAALADPAYSPLLEKICGLLAVVTSFTRVLENLDNALELDEHPLDALRDFRLLAEQKRRLFDERAAGLVGQVSELSQKGVDLPS